MALRMRAWRKRKRDLDLLLRYSDSEDERRGIEDNYSRVPVTPHSFNSDRVIETSDTGRRLDFDAGVDYWSSSTKEEANDDAEVTSSFEDELRQWALEHTLTHRALNDLLAILRKQGHILPVDCRTLLDGGDRMTFPLIKIKITSAKRRECENYNLTSQAEEDEEDQDIMVTKYKKSRTKKAAPEDFLSGLTSSDEEKSIRGVQLPNYPAPPQKIPTVQDTKLLNKASPQYASSVPQRKDLSTPRSRHAVQSAASDDIRDGYRGRSVSGSIIRPRHSDDISRSRSRHSDDICRSRSRHSDDISRSRSRHSDDIYRSRSRHNDATSRSEIGRWAFPLPQDVFQRKVLNLFIDLHDRLHHVHPTSSAVPIKRMETMEDFAREEERLCDSKTFATLVLQISRIGGKDTKGFVYKVLDRLFTNSLMAKFNMKGKGKHGKKSLETTRIYRAIKDGIMNGDSVATEDFIRTHAAEHLKHAPQRSGGGGHGLTQN